MTKQDLRIVYLGTPEFAVASLRALVEGGYNVVAVVTMPDKPAGRGHQLQYSDVKKYALEAGLPVLQPEKLKDEAFVEELRSYQADFFRMLPEVVWAMPRLGTFNIHGSLLPQYRGAAPINWAVMNGEKETGLTTFMLKHEIDTGNMILQERIAIGEEENVGSVHDRLMALSAGDSGTQTGSEDLQRRLRDPICGEDRTRGEELRARIKSLPCSLGQFDDSRPDV